MRELDRHISRSSLGLEYILRHERPPPPPVWASFGTYYLCVALGSRAWEAVGWYPYWHPRDEAFGNTSQHVGHLAVDAEAEEDWNRFFYYVSQLLSTFIISRYLIMPIFFQYLLPVYTFIHLSHIIVCICHYYIILGHNFMLNFFVIKMVPNYHINYLVSYQSYIKWEFENNEYDK